MRSAGFEPATSAFAGLRSVLLSYERAGDGVKPVWRGRVRPLRRGRKTRGFHSLLDARPTIAKGRRPR